MTKEEIQQQIIKKHEQYLKWLKDYYMLPSHIDFESELAELKRELRECKNDKWDNLEDFNQPLDKPIEF